MFHKDPKKNLIIYIIALLICLLLIYLIGEWTGAECWPYMCLLVPFVPTRGNIENIKRRVEQGVSSQFEVYTWWNMLDDCNLTAEEKEWAKYHTSPTFKWVDVPLEVEDIIDSIDG